MLARDATAGGRRWLLVQFLLLVAAAALLLLVFETTDLDRAIARLFYDAEAGLFPLRHLWLLEDFLHFGMKQASTLGVVAAMFVCYRGWRGELAWLPRRNAVLAACGMVLIPLGTTLLKHLTARHCPWDMVDFGGFAPYLHLLSAPPADIKAGLCFPAGHASAGFLWLVWAVALRPAGRKAAWAGLALGLGLGALLGGARMLQGAHFLSHTLWSMWFAWALSVVLAAMLGAELRLGAARQPAAVADDLVDEAAALPLGEAAG